MSKEKMNYAPSTVARVAEDYSASSNYQGQLTCGDCVNDYEKLRIKNFNGFKDVELPNGEKLTAKLNADTPDAKKQREALAGALTGNKILPNTPTSNESGLKPVIDRFNKDIPNFNKLIKNGEFRLGAIASALLAKRSEVLADIDKHHEQVKENINTLFASRFPETLGCSDAADQASLKEKMLAQLDENKKTEAEKVEKAITDQANELFKQAAIQRNRLATLKNQYFHAGKGMRAEIDKQIHPAGSAELHVNDDGSSSALFKNVDISKLPYRKTQDGRVIQIMADGSQYMQANRLYQSPASLFADLTDFCAGFNDPVTITITCKPEDEAKYARMAYEAAIAAGKDPKTTTIKTKAGKVLVGLDEKGETNVKEPKDFAFAEHPELFASLQKTGESYQKRAKEYIEGTAATTQQIKARLNTMRAEDDQQQRQQPDLDEDLHLGNPPGPGAGL